MFKRSLHLYTVHVKPGTDTLTFVREGFNVWGFLFTLAWALYHRLWLPFALMLAFELAVTGLAHAGVFGESSKVALLMAMQVFIGFQGNDWIRRGLQKRGYITDSVVSGDSSLAAQRRYFEQLSPARA